MLKDQSKASISREELARSFSLDDAPGYLIRRIDAHVANLFEQTTGQTALTPRQFGILLRLYQEGPMKQSLVGHRLQIDRATMGEMISRMVARKLVHRSNTASRRSADLSLTPLGRKTLLALVEPARESQERLLSALPVEYRALFLKSLKILAESSS